MKRQFVPDKEISLSKENDYLKTGVYADNLTKIIKNTPHNEVFTVGLFGNWGTGKSSIIETSKNNIEGENPKIKFITYDAWKYANDSFRRMFLFSIQEALGFKREDLQDTFYKNREKSEGSPKFSWYSLIYFAITFIVVFILSEVVTKYGTGNSLLLSLFSAIIVVLVSNMKEIKIINEITETLHEPFFFAPEQFESYFNMMVSKSLGETSFCEKLNCESCITGLEKIVIVIDNVDRCHSAMAYQLLTEVKTFLSNEKYSIVFVIPVDDEALKKHLFNNNSHSADQCNKEKEEFLRKFFNVTLRIKLHQTFEMGTFAKKVNDRYELGFNNDTLSLVAREFATNPRRIIQLFNNLSAEINLYPEVFASNNESVICAIIILREEYYNFYKDVVKNPKLLSGEYKGEKKYYERDDIEQGEPKEEFKETFAFMRMTETYFAHSSYYDLSKIITNTEAQFGSIPLEIQEAIRTADVQKTISFIEANEVLKNDVIQFIQKSILEDSKYGSQLQMATWLNFVSQLQDKISIERNDLVKFNNELSKYYEAIIPQSTNPDLVCKYAKHLSTIGLSQLKEVIFRYIAEDFEKTPNNYESYVEAVLKYFNDENDSKELTKFANKYFSSNKIDKNIAYTDAQRKYLFSDTIVKEIIEAITKLPEDEGVVNELLWLFQNKPNISVDTYGVFFSHLSTTIGDMRNKTKEEILSVIQFLIPFLNVISLKKLTKEPEELYDKLFTERLKNKVGYESYNPTQHSPASYPQAYEKYILINECFNEEEEEESKLIIDFICRIYAVTAGNTAIKPQLEALCENYRIYINSKLIQLLSSGFTLVPLFDVIVSDENYSSDDTVVLITNCFTQKDKEGKLHISEEQITEKIVSLLDNIQNTKAEALLTKIIEDDNLKTIVANNIINRDSDFINSLPQQLLRLAVNTYSSVNARDYAINYTYLGIIAQKGSNNQKTTLVKSLINDIDDNNHIEDVFSILETLELTSNEDKGLLVAHLNSYKSNHTGIESEIASKVNALITKFSPQKKKLLRTKKKTKED